MTLDRFLKADGLKCYVALNKTNLNPVDKDSRRDFAREYVDRDIEFWRRVVFTDETTIKNAFHKTFIRCRPEDRHNIRHYNRKNNRRLSVNIYGFINYFDSQIFRISNNFNRTEMFNLMHHSGVLYYLKQTIPGEIYFQQDNLSVHLVPEVVNLFGDGITLIQNWPARSPDLNPIETVWAILKKKVYKKLQSREVTTNDALFELTKECFNEIGQETIRKLIFKVPFLLEQVLSNDGEMTTG